MREFALIQQEADIQFLTKELREYFSLESEILIEDINKMKTEDIIEHVFNYCFDKCKSYLSFPLAQKTTLDFSEKQLKILKFNCVLIALYSIYQLSTCNICLEDILMSRSKNVVPTYNELIKVVSSATNSFTIDEESMQNKEACPITAKITTKIDQENLRHFVQEHDKVFLANYTDDYAACVSKKRKEYAEKRKKTAWYYYMRVFALYESNDSFPLVRERLGGITPRDSSTKKSVGHARAQYRDLATSFFINFCICPKSSVYPVAENAPYSDHLLYRYSVSKFSHSDDLASLITRYEKNSNNDINAISILKEIKYCFNHCLFLGKNDICTLRHDTTPYYTILLQFFLTTFYNAEGGDKDKAITDLRNYLDQMQDVIKQFDPYECFIPPSKVQVQNFVYSLSETLNYVVDAFFSVIGSPWTFRRNNFGPTEWSIPEGNTIKEQAYQYMLEEQNNPSITWINEDRILHIIDDYYERREMNPATINKETSSKKMEGIQVSLTRASNNVPNSVPKHN